MTIRRTFLEITLWQVEETQNLSSSTFQHTDDENEAVSKARPLAKQQALCQADLNRRHQLKSQSMRPMSFFATRPSELLPPLWAGHFDIVLPRGYL